MYFYVTSLIWVYFGVVSVSNTHSLIGFSISWTIIVFGCTLNWFSIGGKMFHFKTSAHLTKSRLCPCVYPPFSPSAPGLGCRGRGSVLLHWHRSLGDTLEMKPPAVVGVSVPKAEGILRGSGSQILVHPRKSLGQSVCRASSWACPLSFNIGLGRVPEPA